MGSCNRQWCGQSWEDYSVWSHDDHTPAFTDYSVGQLTCRAISEEDNHFFGFDWVGEMILKHLGDEQINSPSNAGPETIGIKRTQWVILIVVGRERQNGVSIPFRMVVGIIQMPIIIRLQQMAEGRAPMFNGLEMEQAIDCS